MGRGKAYTDSQLLVIKAEHKAGLGARKILKNRPGLGFARKGVQNTIDKLKADPTSAPTRSPGSGQKPTKRTPANAAKVRNAIEKSGGRTRVCQENNERG